MGTPTRYYTSLAQDGTLGNSGGISSTATSMYLAATPVGYPGSFPFTLVIDENTASEELVSVTSGAGTSGSPWQITRGFNNTTAKSHGAGAQVGHRFCADDMTTSRAHEASDSTSGTLPHGLPLAAWQQGSFAAINEVTLTNSTTATVTWSSIPQTYAHLLVVVAGRSTYASAQYLDVGCTVNGDSSSVYSEISCDIGNTGGSLTGPTANTQYGKASWNWFIMIAASQAGSNVNIGGGWAILPNYSGTAQNKSFTSMSGFGNGSSSAVASRHRWGWYNPASQGGITSLSLAPSNGDFTTGSFLGLYGLGG